MKGIVIFILLSLLLFVASCAEEGTGDVDESDVLDCGDHGSAHDGHCHCNDGYLFNAQKCVLPDEITDPCEAAEEEHEAHEEEHEEVHGACRCPENVVCPCEGEIVSISGVDFCVPDLHDEE